MERLPFFVYGTLLPHQPNFHCWGDSLLEIRPAMLPHGRLFDVGGFPILIESGAQVVPGCLLTVAESDYETIVARIDYLEQFDPAREDNVYCRVARHIVDADGRRHRAWVYVGDPAYAIGLPPVPANDWAAHSTARAADIARWWAAHIPGHDPFFPPPPPHE